MNKSDLIDVIAKRTSTSHAAARASLDAALDGIAGSLRKGESVTLSGFGTFEVERGTSRRGRGGPAGPARAPKAVKVPKFKPGKALRDSVN